MSNRCRSGGFAIWEVKCMKNSGDVNGCHDYELCSAYSQQISLSCYESLFPIYHELSFQMEIYNAHLHVRPLSDAQPMPLGHALHDSTGKRQLTKEIQELDCNHDTSLRNDYHLPATRVLTPVRCFVMLWSGQARIQIPQLETVCMQHVDVIKWKHFPRYWPFVRGIHRSPVNSPHKGQWRGALMFSLICTWINGWVNNGEAGDFETPSRPLWRHCNGNVECHYSKRFIHLTHYIDVTLKWSFVPIFISPLAACDLFKLEFGWVLGMARC